MTPSRAAPAGGDAVAAGTVAVPAPGVVAVAVADEVVLLDERSGVLHLLNPSAARVWAALDGRRSVAAVGRTMAVAHGVDVADVAQPVSALVAQLAAAGLVTLSEDAPAAGAGHGGDASPAPGETGGAA